MVGLQIHDHKPRRSSGCFLATVPHLPISQASSHLLLSQISDVSSQFPFADGGLAPKSPRRQKTETDPIPDLITCALPPLVFPWVHLMSHQAPLRSGFTGSYALLLPVAVLLHSCHCSCTTDILEQPQQPANMPSVLPSGRAKTCLSPLAPSHGHSVFSFPPQSSPSEAPPNPRRLYFSLPTPT